jgi:hypothetical protein
VFWLCPFFSVCKQAHPLPTDQGGKELEADYRSMRPMFFSEPPGWGTVLDQLQGLEDEINQLSLEP